MAIKFARPISSAIYRAAESLFLLGSLVRRPAALCRLWNQRSALFIRHIRHRPHLPGLPIQLSTRAKCLVMRRFWWVLRY